MQKGAHSTWIRSVMSSEVIAEVIYVISSGRLVARSKSGASLGGVDSTYLDL